MSAQPPDAVNSRPLTGLHLLLTYECNFECDHCFVWGGPAQTGTMTSEIIDRILDEAVSLGTIEWVYFEGGEPFLYYDILRYGIRKSREFGFKIGVVTNAYWAESLADARDRLEPLAGSVDDFSVSRDAYHGSVEGAGGPDFAREAARELGIPTEFITVAQPAAADVRGATGQLPPGESAVMYRGRAAELLAPRVQPVAWERFDSCPWENLRHPERMHVDPYGHLHVCQGISIGNLLERPLSEIVAGYRPDDHPIVGPLLAGGPAEIVRRFGLPHRKGYADHCHLCYESRCALRERFPHELTPEQMYGAG